MRGPPPAIEQSFQWRQQAQLPDFNAFNLPHVPTRDRHAEHLSTRQLEIGSSENFICSSRADEHSEAILLREAGGHLSRPVRMFIDEKNDATVEWLRAEPLSNVNH
jgi:hypothetical protein